MSHVEGVQNTEDLKDHNSDSYYPYAILERHPEYGP